MKDSASELPFRIDPSTVEGDPNHILPVFPILPFTKYDGNPILVPEKSHPFESGYLYNPTAMVLDNTIFLFYRAQTPKPELVSSIGLAWSTDGVNFTRLDKPIISPSEPWEFPGGCEGTSRARLSLRSSLTASLDL